ncbi:hypothetical protein OIU79_010137 [Salix purpurea]|uniref:Uncharacterized protein n=1 Tax=Salix purpurea TaxID=77065 RepID=A0A9Q0QG02_SALPP|nr:hypothetical protein OIU79_010137 [Salix purpurea]
MIDDVDEDKPMGDYIIIYVDPYSGEPLKKLSELSGYLSPSSPAPRQALKMTAVRFPIFKGLLPQVGREVSLMSRDDGARSLLRREDIGKPNSELYRSE